MIRLFLIIILLNFTSFKLLAQKPFNLKIEFLQKIDIKNLSVVLFDGLDPNIKLKFKTNKSNLILTTNGHYFTKYANISISYQENGQGFQKQFWVFGKYSTVRFLKNSSNNPIGSFELVNCFDINKEGKSFYDYVGNEQDNYYNYFYENREKLNEVAKYQTLDSLGKVFSNKQYKYVKLYPQKYFSLWHFLKMAHSRDISTDSLFYLYDNSFSNLQKKTFEGKEIFRILMVRKLSKGSKSPSFNTIDIFGNKIYSEDFLGKTVLINFWATWCGPCVEEIPVLQNIKEKYPETIIISVSLDKEINTFKKYVKKANMNWTHIFRDNNLHQKFNSNYGVPSNFLINKNGIIEYSSTEEKDKNFIKLLSIFDKL